MKKGMEKREELRSEEEEKKHISELKTEILPIRPPRTVYSMDTKEIFLF